DRRAIRWALTPQRRQKFGPRVRFYLLPRLGRDGNYLFELEAQPGGPEGRSDTTAGSWPIRIVERPRNFPASRSCCLLIVVGRVSWFQCGGTSSQTRCKFIIAPSPTPCAAGLSLLIPGTTTMET